MIEFVDDAHLKIALFDAMRDVKLASLKRALTEEERDALTAAMFAKFNRCDWRVLVHLDGRSAHSKFTAERSS